MTPPCAISQVSAGETVLKAKHTTDFVITGDGSAANWNNTKWLVLPQHNKASFPYSTKVKVLYSDGGIYCLYDARIKKSALR